MDSPSTSRFPPEITVAVSGTTGGNPMEHFSAINSLKIRRVPYESYRNPPLVVRVEFLKRERIWSAAGKRKTVRGRGGFFSFRRQ